jgi:hypothetical protein
MKSSIIYYHQSPPGFQAKVIQFFFGALRMKKQMLKKIINNDYPKKAAPLPKSLLNNLTLKKVEHSGRSIWKINSQKKGAEPDSHKIMIIYLIPRAG